MNELENLTEEERRAAAAAVAKVRKAREELEKRKAALDNARSVLAERVEDGEELQVWTARQNSDLTEGRGMTVMRGMFANLEDAVAAAYLLEGVMGSSNISTRFPGSYVGRERIYLTLDEWLRTPGTGLRNQSRLQAVAESGVPAEVLDAVIEHYADRLTA